MLTKPILQGGTVILRPITAADADVFYAHFDDPDVNYFTGTYQTFTREQVQAHYAHVANADDRADYAIVLQADPDTIVGEVVLNDIDDHNHSANFRIALLSKRFFGHGYGSQATRLIIQYGFEQLNLHRIELEVYTFNPRAAHVYEKVGFVREGVRRDVLFWDGAYHDAITMSMLRDEYERHYKT